MGHVTDPVAAAVEEILAVYSERVAQAADEAVTALLVLGVTEPVELLLRPQPESPAEPD